MRLIVSVATCALWIGCAGKTASEDGEGPAEGTDDSGDPTDPCQAGDAPALRLGHGELEYMDIDPSEEVLAELIHGPQGGFHINMGLAATGLDPSYPWAVDLQGTIDGALVGQTRPLATMRCNRADDELQAWGLLLIYDAQPEELHDRVTDIVATVIDSAGTGITATGTVRIWDPTLE
jgi:hypothetical protein